MPEIVFREESPSFTFLATRPQIKAGSFQFMISLVPGINRPAHTIQLEDKGAAVHVPVVNSATTTLTAEVVAAIVPFVPGQDYYRIRSISFPGGGHFFLILFLVLRDPDKGGTV